MVVFAESSLHGGATYDRLVAPLNRNVVRQTSVV